MRFLITIALIVLLIYLYIQYVVSSIKIKFDGLENVGLSGFDINSLNLNQTVITVRVKLLITLTSFFGISISNLNIKAYSNGLLVAESTPNFPENIKKITLQSNINNEVYQTFNFHINAQTISLIGKIKSKQPYSIDYTASLKIFGIPVNKSGTFNKQ